MGGDGTSVCFDGTRFGEPSRPKAAEGGRAADSARPAEGRGAVWRARGAARWQARFQPDIPRMTAQRFSTAFLQGGSYRGREGKARRTGERGRARRIRTGRGPAAARAPGCGGRGTLAEGAARAWRRQRIQATTCRLCTTAPLGRNIDCSGVGCRFSPTGNLLLQALWSWVNMIWQGKMCLELHRKFEP